VLELWIGSEREVRKRIAAVLGRRGLGDRVVGRFFMITGLTLAPSPDITDNCIEILKILGPRLQRLTLVPPMYESFPSDSAFGFYEALIDFPSNAWSSLVELEIRHAEGEYYTLVHVITRLTPAVRVLTIHGADLMVIPDETKFTEDEDAFRSEIGPCPCCLERQHSHAVLERCERCQREPIDCCGMTTDPYSCECQSTPTSIPAPSTLNSLEIVNLSYHISKKDNKEAPRFCAYLADIFSRAPSVTYLYLEDLDIDYDNDDGLRFPVDLPEQIKDLQELHTLHWSGSAWPLQEYSLGGGFLALREVHLHEPLVTQAGCRIEVSVQAIAGRANR
jgi:hypothetical protein